MKKLTTKQLLEEVNTTFKQLEEYETVVNIIERTEGATAEELNTLRKLNKNNKYYSIIKVSDDIQTVATAKYFKAVEIIKLVHEFYNSSANSQNEQIARINNIDKYMKRHLNIHIAENVKFNEVANMWTDEETKPVEPAKPATVKRLNRCTFEIIREDAPATKSKKKELTPAQMEKAIEKAYTTTEKAYTNAGFKIRALYAEESDDNTAVDVMIDVESKNEMDWESDWQEAEKIAEQLETKSCGLYQIHLEVFEIGEEFVY